MTDIYITITDEDGKCLRSLNIYCDGSDSEEAGKIEEAIIDLYQPRAIIDIYPREEEDEGL